MSQLEKNTTAYATGRMVRTMPNLLLVAFQNHARKVANGREDEDDALNHYAMSLGYYERELRRRGIDVDKLHLNGTYNGHKLTNDDFTLGPEPAGGAASGGAAGGRRRRKRVSRRNRRRKHRRSRKTRRR